MTLDEAIQHCHDVAKENRKTALEYARAYAWDTAHGCRECANEHEQLANWLVELKARRDASINEMEKRAWRKCSDFIPEQDEMVLVAVYGSDMVMQLEGESVADAFARNRKQGYVTVGFIGSDGWYGAGWYPMMIAPTYWMPLPGLPEVNEDEAD